MTDAETDIDININIGKTSVWRLLDTDVDNGVGSGTGALMCIDVIVDTDRYRHGLLH